MSSPHEPTQPEKSHAIDATGDERPSVAVRGSRARTWATAALLFVLIGGATGYIAQRVQGAREEGLLDEAPRHHRPIVKEDGKTLLWARNLPGGEAEWFDMTGALVDPADFEHGIGKDRIASIDKPAFLPANDRRLRDFGILESTVVIGWEHEGEAKAYPIGVLNRHELVNDWVGGKPVTVGW